MSHQAPQSGECLRYRACGPRSGVWHHCRVPPLPTDPLRADADARVADAAERWLAHPEDTDAYAALVVAVAHRRSLTASPGRRRAAHGRHSGQEAPEPTWSQDEYSTSYQEEYATPSYSSPYSQPYQAPAPSEAELAPPAPAPQAPAAEQAPTRPPVVIDLRPPGDPLVDTATDLPPILADLIETGLWPRR